MSKHQGDENDCSEENHEIKDVNDAVDEGFCGREMDYMELYDADGYDFMDNKITDTSSAQAKRGKDIQGITWERLSVTKKKYRRTRLQRYRNYESIPRSGEELGKELKPTKKGGMFYDFRNNRRAVKSSIHHFQKRPFGMSPCDADKVPEMLVAEVKRCLSEKNYSWCLDRGLHGDFLLG